MDKFKSAGTPWLIGGDFNLLPLGQYQRLPAEQRTPYSADSPRIKRIEAQVRQGDTLRISDHLPVIARFLLPAAP